VEVGTETQKTITGSYDRKQSITGYKNLSEMRRIVDQACDIKSYQQLQAFYDDNPGMASNFSRPPHDVLNEMVEPTEIQDLLFDDLEIREEIVIQSYKDREPGEDPPIKDNPLVVTSDGSRIANDLRIYQEEFGDIDSSLDGVDQKIDVLVENVIGYYEGDLGATMDGDADEPDDAVDVGGTDTSDDIEDAETVQAGADEEDLEDTFFPITDLEEVDARQGHYATVETEEGTAVVADTRTFSVMEEVSFSHLFFEEVGPSGKVEQADLRGGIRSFKERGEDIIRIQRLSLDTTRLDTQTGAAWRVRVESNLDVTAEDLMAVLRRHGLADEVGANVIGDLKDFGRPKTQFGRENPSREVAIGEVNRSAWGVGQPLRDKERDNPPPRNQIIFSDQISLAAGGTGDFFRLIKRRLVEEGIPEDEIVILTGSEMTLPDGNGGFTERAPNDKQQAKLQIQERFNTGTHTVLLANQTAEEGMNLDKYGVATHHLDIPYRPTRLQQRDGRMVRQGNEYGSVDVIFYLLGASFDEYRLQLVQSKQGWIDQLFYGEARKADSQDTSKSLSYEEMQAATAEDDRVAEFFEARNEVSQLQNQLDALESEEAQLQSTVAVAERDLGAREERVMATISNEQEIQNRGFGYLTPEDALASGDMEIDISTSFRGKVKWSIDLDMTEERSFGGFGEDLEIEIEVPGQNPNARVTYVSPFTGIEQKRRRTYLIPPKSASRLGPVRKALQLAAKELTLLEANTVAQSESLQSFAQLLELGDYEDTPTRSQRLAFTGTLLASDTWAYDELGIENPDEDRGDLTWKEYKEDLGFGNLGFWRTVLRDRLAALFWLHERRWHRRSERRKKQAREEIDTVRTRLESAQEQLADVQSTMEDVNERLQENRETVSDLRSVVNEIQTRPYDTRPEIYERLNEIREDYGIENEIPMRIVQDDREGYLAYMRGAQRSIQQRQDDEATRAPEPDEEITVPGAARTGEEEAPIVGTRRELAAVYEAQTGT